MGWSRNLGLTRPLLNLTCTAQPRGVALRLAVTPETGTRSGAWKETLPLTALQFGFFKPYRVSSLLIFLSFL